MGRGEGRGIVEEEEFFKKYRDTRHLKMLKQEMLFFIKILIVKKERVHIYLRSFSLQGRFPHGENLLKYNFFFRLILGTAISKLRGNFRKRQSIVN